jgi:hypothetical protein
MVFYLTQGQSWQPGKRIGAFESSQPIRGKNLFHQWFANSVTTYSDIKTHKKSTHAVMGTEKILSRNHRKLTIKGLFEFSQDLDRDEEIVL